MTASRTCSSCGATVRESASFCRNCGGPIEVEDQGDELPPAQSDAPTVLTCSGCGAEVGADAAFCRACGAPTAATAEITASKPIAPSDPAAPIGLGSPAFSSADDATSPDAGSEPTSPLRPVATPPQPDGPASTMPPAPAGGRPGKRGLSWVLGGLAVLAVAAGGAWYVTRSNTEDAGNAATASSDLAGEQGTTTNLSPDVTSSSDPADGATEPHSANVEAGYPAESDQMMEIDISRMLIAYHRAILAGDQSRTWNLLSSRKQQQYEQENGGEPTWWKHQETLAPYLGVGGLKARIDELEGDGVARVNVTGMTWSGPESDCTRYEGLTWVKYEDGKWLYDPGYSTTTEREQEWKPRDEELLGVGC